MLSFLLFTLFLIQESHNPIPLWPAKAPSAVGDDPADVPSITPYLPAKEKASGAAVVICPGGGYGFLANDHEGVQIARWLNQRGIAAFILKYRIVSKNRPAPLHPAPLMDVQRAIRTVRSKAAEYGVETNKIGVWGFSAGGHLASSAAVHFALDLPRTSGAIDKQSCRPDFAILGYPVISMKTGISHGGSRNNLLGKSPDPSLVELMSNDQAVTKETPPTFLFHTDEDKGVPPMNSVLFYMALKKHGVPAELHIYEKGVHGVGLAPEKIPEGSANYVPKLRPVDKGLWTWTDRLHDWLDRRGLVK
jgi:acetyl esterase/lipase